MTATDPEQTPGPPLAVRRRLARRILLVAFLLTGAVWFAFWGAIHGWFPELQRRVAVAVLNSEQDSLVIDIEALGGSLVDGFEIEGVVVRPGASRPDLRAALRVEKMSFAIDVQSIYADRLVHVPVLEFDGVVVDWFAQAGSATPAVEPAPAPAGANPNDPAAANTAPWRFAIDDLRLRDGRLRATLNPGEDTTPFETEGSAHVRGLAWSNDGGSPQFEDFAADLRLVDARVGPIDIESGRARVVGTPEGVELRVENVQASAENRGRLHLAGNGHARFEDGQPRVDALVLEALSLDLAFSNLDLAVLVDQHTSDRRDALAIPHTRLNGAAHLTRPDSWQIDLELDPSEVDGFAFTQGRGRAHFASDLETWRLEDAAFETETGKVSLSGHGTRETFDALDIDARDLPLETLQRLAGRGDAKADDAPGEALVGHVDLAARLSGAPAKLRGTVEASGVATYGERPSLDYAVALRLEEAGAVRLDELEVATLDGTASLRASQASTWRFAGGTVSAGKLKLEFRDGDGPKGLVDIERLASDGKRHHIDAHFDRLDFTPVATLLGETTPVEGSLSGTLEFDNRRGDPSIEAALALDEPRIEGHPFDQLRLDAHTEASLWKLESRLAWHDLAPFSLSLVLPATGFETSLHERLTEPRTRVAFDVSDLDVRHLATFLPDTLLGEDALEGTLRGRFTLVGNPAGPVVEGDMVWAGARLGAARADEVVLRAETIDGLLGLRFDITHEAKRALSAITKLELARLVEDPTGWMRDPQHRSVLLAEDVDLAWLVPRASARRLGRVEALEGSATGRLEVRGSPEGPVITGSLDVVRARLELALFDEPIGPIEASLRFDNKALQVERLMIASKKGPMIVKGSYRWPAASRLDHVDLTARFDKFSLTHFPLLEARVTGDLEVAGPLSALDASGDLAFKRVHLSLPAAQDPLLREVRILGLEEPEAGDESNPRPAQPSAYQTMKAQLAIDVRPGARVRERGADLEVEGQILLRKRRLSPTLLQGSLATTGGTYTFFGRTFDVREGVATFEERLPPDPDLRIEATRHIGEVTVGVRRVGRWSEPAAELFSEPEMEETDILSYLMFNKRRSELGAADDAQLNSATAQVASNLALAELTRALADELPINEISMEVGEDMTVSSVGVETNVGEDIILRYDRALQDGVGDRFTVEWRFWKSLSLRSEYAEGGTSGLDLFWSYEY
ncbi:MAG: translocation/assembly module TamB domain-containing protein [Myxococcota bacterium]|nr:translocation/assembly module TamB domain-containing protein [Myxococcota bacterium]